MDQQITPADVLKAGNDVATATQEQYSLPQLLQNALIQKFSTANPTVQARNQAVQNLYSAPEEAALKYGSPQTVTIGGGQVPPAGQNPVGEQITVPNVYYSPLEQRELQSKYIGAKLAPVMNLTNLLSTQTGGIEGLVNNARSMYEAQTQSQQKKYDTALDLAKLQEQIRQTNLQYGIGGTGSTSDENGNSFTERRIQQNRYNNISNPQLKEAIASAWKTSHGNSLFPSPGTFQTLNDIQQTSPNILNKTGTVTANVALFKQKFPGGYGRGFISKGDEQDLIGLESKYFALVQKAITTIQGSRPSDYDAKSYQQSIGPSIQNTPEVNAARIQNLITLMGIEPWEMKGIQTGNQDKGSSGTQGSSGNSPNSGTIRVKNNATGQTGTMPAKNFDPKKYTKL